MNTCATWPDVAMVAVLVFPFIAIVSILAVSGRKS
jgi:hypothetical protein